MAEYKWPYSPSSITRYLDCPYNFYLRYIRGIKIEAGEAANFGKAIHKVNEMFWSEHRLQPDHSLAMQETINKYWDNNISEEYEIASHECIENFLTSIKEIPQITPLHTEFKAENKINNTVAIIDVVYPDKIRDYKTSKHFTVSPKLPNLIQAVMCAENLKQSLGLEIKKVEFQYLRFNKYQVVDITEELNCNINKIIEETKLNVANDIFPKITKSCFFCDYVLICKAEKKALEKRKGSTWKQALF